MTFDKFDEKYRYNVCSLNDGYLSIGEYKYHQKLLIGQMVEELKTDVPTISREEND